jgi:hypothetical protein
MANKLISEATYKTELAATDMVPVAKSGEATAYHVTGANIFNSIPDADASTKGKVELATDAEIAAGMADKVVEAGGLAGSLAGSHLVTIASAPPTVGTIDAAFATEFDRSRVNGDLITLEDSDGDLYILVYDLDNTAWHGLNATDGAFVTYT